jgi:translocation and assembly module TamB
MGRLAKWLLVLAAFVVAVIVVDVAALWVFMKTNWGHERVRSVAENQLNKVVHGKATVSRVSGNLVSNLTLQNVVITDSAGGPFVSVDSLTVNYSIADLLRKRIDVDGAVFYRPFVVLDQLPNGKWNWQRIFPQNPSQGPPSNQPQWGQRIRIANADIVDGRFILTTPWAPQKGLSQRAADSVTREALKPSSRVDVRRVAGGYQRRIELDSMTGHFPLVRVAEPGQPSSLLQISKLSMHAFPLRPPGPVVRDLRGTFAFTTDSIWWQRAYADLPNSKVSGSGAFSFLNGNFTLDLRGDPVTFADVKWAYDPLPPEARGKLDFGLRWRGNVQEYLVTNADVTLRQSHAAGSFGITIGDTVVIHNTDVRFSGIDTRTLRELVPGVSIPRTGVFAGRATVGGGRKTLKVKGHVSFNDRVSGVSRFGADGEVGFLDNGSVRLRGLRLDLQPLQVALFRAWRPGLPSAIGGTITGTTTLTGTTSTQIAMTMDIAHHDSAATSNVAGSATLHIAGPTQVDVDVVAFPLALATVGRFAPSLGLRSDATGPIHVHGPLNDLRINAELRFPDGGKLVAKTTFDFESEAKGYDVVATLDSLDVHTAVEKAPATSLTGRVTASGHGTDLATLDSKVAADFSTSRVLHAGDSIAFDTASVRASAANGDAHLEKFFIAGAQTRASASGGFGLDDKHIDSLNYAIAVDSVGALNRWLPRSTDSAAVKPRPGVIARAKATARADSARIAKRTEMERMLRGTPGPRLVVVVPTPVRRDTMSGRLFVVGTLRGNVDTLDLHGRAEADSIIARGNTVERARADYAWMGGRRTPSVFAVIADADHVSALGFGFDTVSGRLSYAAPGPEDDGGRGQVELSLLQRDSTLMRRYFAKGDYSLHPDRRVLRLADLTLQFDSTQWGLAHPDTLQWGKAGIRVAGFDLRNPQGGRVRMKGSVPANGSGDLTIDVDSFPVANVSEIAQSDVQADGELSLHGSVRGTVSHPIYSARFALTDADVNQTPVPDFVGRVSYADERLVAHMDALHGTGEPMMAVDARLPLNLALTGVTGDRVLPEPMMVDVVGDSLPIDLIPDFTDLVTDVRGRAAGKMSLRGTFKQPILAGAVAVDHGTTTIAATGATIENINGMVHLSGDTVFVDSLAGTAGGDVRLAGTIGFGSLQEPSFDLMLSSNGARLIHNDDADLRIDSRLTLKGPFKKAAAGGTIGIARGVIAAPEGSERTLVGPGDNGLFNVIDTTSEVARRLFPSASPLLANLSVNVAVSISPNTWVRNREANIEIYTVDPLSIRDSNQTLIVTGVITTDRGDYTLLTKRFLIRRGTATFVGTPGLNPSLEITGEFQVQVASRGALNIRVLVGGTLDQPKVSLESDAQPPRSQSELLTLIAFGQSTSSLIASNNSTVISSGTSTELVGSGTQFAARRLQSVALGVAAEQAEAQVGKTIGADVFRITPADTPLELGSGGFTGFFKQTRIEAGKYVDPQTFVALQQQASAVGASVERRIRGGWRITATWEPQLLLLEPTLNSQPYRTTRSVGGFVIRDWRF